MLPISAHGTTFPGRRDVNQDDILHFYPSPDSFFLGVADGMGGVAGGQIASQTVLQTVETVLKDEFEDAVSPDMLKEILDKAFDAAQASIREITEQDPSLDGMGTTLTCVLGCENRFVAGNLGDSRVYHLTDGEIQQVTEDHSYLREFEKEAGEDNIDPEFIEQYGHIINKTLDGSGDEPDYFPKEAPFYELQEEDGFLLCSDGLIVDKLQDQKQLFKSYMMGTPDLQTAAESLVSLAYYSGSTDNISAVLAEAGTLERELGRVRTYPFPPREEEPA
ncbi:MAG TPA: protein phosphatase 2C domain-containing protein [Salinibacter sp.]|nr:protein phosphatase 2C domain-containing protein [Salinibacter sp.]